MIPRKLGSGATLLRRALELERWYDPRRRFISERAVRWLPLPRRPVRSAWTPTSRGGLPLHDVPPYQRPFRGVHGDAPGGPGPDRVGRAALVPIVSGGSARVLRDLRIEPVLGACLRRSSFDRCWHLGFTDGARDGSSRVRRRCRRLLRDRRRFASEGGWRSWHHDPRRLILHAATARMPW